VLCVGRENAALKFHYQHAATALDVLGTVRFVE